MNRAEFEKLSNPEFGWGGLYIPRQHKQNRSGGLRLAFFGSTNAGNLVLGQLLKYEAKYPGRLNIVGVATDDPVDPDTRISVAKRIWGKYTREEMTSLRDKVITTSLSHGLPCYTGGVKNDLFWEIYSGWDPEMVIMCCFGQKISKPIFTYPAYGMYNFHPSDLAKSIGAGPKPFEETMKQKRSTSRMVIHLVNEIIDGGPLIASSPPVNICLENCRYPDNILTLQEKIPSVSGWMGIELLLEVLRQKDQSRSGCIEPFDLEARIPDHICKKLMEPAKENPEELYLLPEHDCLK